MAVNHGFMGLYTLRMMKYERNLQGNCAAISCAGKSMVGSEIEESYVRGCVDAGTTFIYL